MYKRLIIAAITAVTAVSTIFVSKSIIEKKVDEKTRSRINEGIQKKKKEIYDQWIKYKNSFLISWVRNLSILIFSHYLAIILDHNPQNYVAIAVFIITVLMLNNLSKMFSLLKDPLKDLLKIYLEYTKYHTFNAKEIISLYIYSKVDDEVSNRIHKLDNLERFFFNYFGESKESITKKIHLVFVEYLKSYMRRVILLGIGFVIYFFIFDKLFLFLVDIDFKSWYEPIIWPYTILFKILD